MNATTATGFEMLVQLFTQNGPTLILLAMLLIFGWRLTSKEEIHQLDLRVTKVEGKVEVLIEDVSELRASVKEIKADITEMKGDIREMKASIQLLLSRD